MFAVDLPLAGRFSRPKRDTHFIKNMLYCVVMSQFLMLKSFISINFFFLLTPFLDSVLLLSMIP